MMPDFPTIHESTFEKLFGFYARGLVLYAKRFVGLEEEAKDVVHDVFVNFWERLEDITAENIKSYLFVSTRNRCLDRLAKLRRGNAYIDKIMHENACFEENIDLFVESDLMRRIESAIDRLPLQRKRVFIMSKIEGKSYVQIGHELDISPKTVDKHLETAIKSLRSELSAYKLP